MPTETLPPEVLDLVVCNAVNSAETYGVTHKVEVVVTTGRRLNALRLPDYSAATGPTPGVFMFPPGAGVVMAVARGDYRSAIVTGGGFVFNRSCRHRTCRRWGRSRPCP